MTRHCPQRLATVSIGKASRRRAGDWAFARNVKTARLQKLLRRHIQIQTKVRQSLSLELLFHCRMVFYNYM